MAIYNPIASFPSGGNAIDATQNNLFTWAFVSDAGEIQTSFQLVIYTLSNSIVYDTGIVSVSTQFHNVPAGILSNGTTYKWKITTNGKTTNIASVFYAIATQSVTIVALPSPFIHQYYTFNWDYSQVQSIKLQEYEAFLYDASDVLLERSGIIVSSTTPIQYEFSGFDNLTTYKVAVWTKNQYGIEYTTTKTSFTTNYNVPYDPDAIQVASDENSGTNIVDWSNIVAQTGYVDGMYSYVSGVWDLAIKLEDDAILNYDLNTNIPNVFEADLFIKLPLNFNGDFIRFYYGGELIYRIGYNAVKTKFYYERDYRITFGSAIALPTGFFKFIIKPKYIGYEISSTQYTLR